MAVSLALMASALDLAPAVGANPVQNLSVAGQDAERPQVAVDAKGNAFVVWERPDGASTRIQLRRRTAAGNLSSVKSLSTAGQDAHNPQVAVDAKGNAFVVWERYDGANWRIQLRRRAHSGRLSAVKTLSAPGEDAFGAQVAVDAKGNALVVWYLYDAPQG